MDFCQALSSCAGHSGAKSGAKDLRGGPHTLFLGERRAGSARVQVDSFRIELRNRGI